MADEFYVSIEGTKQGKFKGESFKEAHKEKIRGLGFSYEVKSPHDTATGQPRGKRQHTPITITKPWGAATPQIFQALVTNEVLKRVVIEFVHTTPEGAEEIYHRITLSEAAIVQLKQYTQSATTLEQGVLDEKSELEDVSFSFKRIEMTNLWGKTSATDEWDK
ncbi:type VI secretion system tube protein Hcp [Cyanobacteria bacterium FACHB-63]|nr:type VI secretion system tube protein Hcp [Cyanobacteria bacterium FACHB-63]